MIPTIVLVFKDHPRVGGEKKEGRAKCPPLKGSPPRGRGKVISLEAIKGAVGITPAWAGKSNIVVGDPSRVRDHPRVGGEKR